MAKQNVNICMIIRNKEKGEKLIQELSATSSSKFRIVIADFVKCTELDFFDKIYEQIKDLDIGVLINNVGVSMVISSINLEKPFWKIEWNRYDSNAYNKYFPHSLPNKKNFTFDETKKN